MPKIIPKGGKRIHQVKVNFNEPEKAILDKLKGFFGTDSSRTLRQLLINWDNLERYVVSLDEIISKVSDICLYDGDNLPNHILNKLNSLVECARFLSDECWSHGQMAILVGRTRKRFTTGREYSLCGSGER